MDDSSHTLLLIIIGLIIAALGFTYINYEGDPNECYQQIAEQQCDLIDAEVSITTFYNNGYTQEFECSKDRTVVAEYLYTLEDREKCKRGLF